MQSQGSKASKSERAIFISSQPVLFDPVKSQDHLLVGKWQIGTTQWEICAVDEKQSQCPGRICFSFALERDCLDFGNPHSIWESRPDFC